MERLAGELITPFSNRTSWTLPKCKLHEKQNTCTNNLDRCRCWSAYPGVALYLFVASLPNKWGPAGTCCGLLVSFDALNNFGQLIPMTNICQTIRGDSFKMFCFPIVFGGQRQIRKWFFNLLSEKNQRVF